MVTIDRYAVMGNPIGHSQSPLIHRLFAEQTGEWLSYDAILVARDGFAAAVDAFRARHGRGLNVTVPFKRQAWAYADRRSARAERAGAVNTLVLDTQVYGDNTDGPGLVQDLTANHGFRLAGKRLLLVGAGGAARGVLAALLAGHPSELTIANRTATRATGLAAQFADLGPVRGCGLGQLGGQSYELVINATAAGLHDEVPALPADCLAAGGWCYDMMYGDRPTAFVRWGKDHGAARAVDGLGMLVEQAAESFLLWRGVRPDTRPVISALRA